ncbi:hypothetical protein CCR78_07795 [Rhodovulum imhoffii]|nr:DUF6524 family protein [Rhodovulum imhoffii]MBK5933872.1 hypothetical protein [Rhodovulum imhoffii]
MGFFLRWVFAFVLLAVTYNPTQYNFVTWAMGAWEGQLPFVVLGSLLLLVCYVIYLRATLRSIGIPGMLLILAIMTTVAWVLIDRGVLVMELSSLNTWLILAGLSLVLGIGLSWSIIRRRLSGQADVDDVDE